MERRGDHLDRVTLRFLDPDLERAYQANVLETRRRRQRAATLGGAAIFASLALLTPALTGLPVMPVTPILVVLAVANLVAAALVSSAGTTTGLDAVGIGIQVGTGSLILLLCVAIGEYTRFAAPALMAQAVFAFGVSRHPFRNAVMISAAQTGQYLLFGIAAGHAPGILVDGFILAAAVTGASFGTYRAERGERQLFVQDRELEALHQRVDELLHRYLAPEVADVLIADPSRAALGGQEVEVTVLFADLTGFTSFSERVAPDAAVRMLNDAFAAAVPAVQAQGGTIVQFAGDAVMVVFNAPVPQPDHALRAARAALALQRATAAPVGESATPRFRVGLSTGPALVGNVGTAESQSFTAIGDVTNLAARLQTFAPPGSVVLGPRTRELLGDRAKVRLLGQPLLKGKSAPVAVYELVAVRGDQ
jgi:class 3 adenylate cyclase